MGSRLPCKSSTWYLILSVENEQDWAFRTDSKDILALSSELRRVDSLENIYNICIPFCVFFCGYFPETSKDYLFTIILIILVWFKWNSFSKWTCSNDTLNNASQWKLISRPSVQYFLYTATVSHIDPKSITILLVLLSVTTKRKCTILCYYLPPLPTNVTW